MGQIFSNNSLQRRYKLPRILIIDDDPATRFVMAGGLKDAGYEVFEAQSGKDGLCVFAQAAPDLVITDMLMPDMDGIEVIVELQSISPLTTVFAMSAGGSVAPGNILGTAGMIGATNIFYKPIDQDNLLAHIRSAIG